MNLKLRKADFKDIEFLWFLRNQPEVFKYFKNNKPVKWQEHLSWIMPIMLGFSNKELYVIEHGNKPAGQIRIDNNKEVSISLLKEFQGKGLGSKALALALRKWKKLEAQIHKENKPSIRLFEKVGFRLKGKKGIWLKYES